MQRVEHRLNAEIAGRRAAMAMATSATADGASGDDGSAAAARRLFEGHRLLDAGHAAEAVPILEAANDLLPRDSPAWLEGTIHLELGLALKRSGNPGDAHRHFDKAIDTRRFRAADRARFELEKRGEDAALCVASGAPAAAPS